VKFWLKTVVQKFLSKLILNLIFVRS